MKRMFRLVAVAAVLVVTVTAGTPRVVHAARPSSPPPNTAFDAICTGTSERARAAVVIDLGNGDVRGSCVEFDGTITGIEALRRAGADPVVRGYGGDLGGGICALCGVGCPGDNSCLTCAAPKSWAYYRKAAGTGSFVYSRAGAGNTTVHDGDVEGWTWTSSSPNPPATTAPPAPPAAPGGSTTGTTAAPSGVATGGGDAPAANGGAPGAGGGAPGAPGGTASPGSVSTVADSTERTDPSATTEPGATEDVSTTTVSERTTEREAALPAVSSGSRESSSSSSALAVVLMGVVLVAVVGAASWLRLRRRHATGDVG